MPRSAGYAGVTPRPTSRSRWPGASGAPWWRTSCSPARRSASPQSTAPRLRLSCPRSLPPPGLSLVFSALAGSGRSRAAPAAVGAYIGAAYFFTSSTSFANPAIVVGRMFSDTFAGIAPSSVPSFIAAEIIGGALAVAVIRALYPGVTPAEAADIIVPHHRDWPDADTQTSPARPGPASQAAAGGSHRFPSRATEYRRPQ